MKRKILAMLLCGAMMMTMLSACGGSDDATESESAADTSGGEDADSDASTSDSAEADSDAAGDFADYAEVDETGIIHYNLEEHIKRKGGSVGDNRTEVDLDSEAGAFSDTMYFDVIVTWETVSEFTLEGNADTALSYTYAENPTKEEVDMLGMHGWKTSFVDTNSFSGTQINDRYFLAPPETAQDGSEGYYVILAARYEADQADIVEAQLNDFAFDFDAYSFAADEDGAE